MGNLAKKVLSFQNDLRFLNAVRNYWIEDGVVTVPMFAYECSKEGLPTEVALAHVSDPESTLGKNVLKHLHYLYDNVYDSKRGCLLI